MNVGWLKPGKRHLKRQLSISGPLNFQHIQHIGHNDVFANSKKLSRSFQNIAELCRALSRQHSAGAELQTQQQQQPGSQRCSRASSAASLPNSAEADLFNEITNCLAPELKSFLITDTPETSEKDEDEVPSPTPPPCTTENMGCATSTNKDTDDNQFTVTPDPPQLIKPVLNKGPEKPTRKHKTLRKVSDTKNGEPEDLISDIITCNKSQNHLKVEGLYNTANKENLSNNLPPPITPRTAKKLKLKDDLFREMISKYCCPENPSTRLREVKKLGQGSSGVVVLVSDSVTSKQLALKKMNLHRQQRRDLLVNEVSVGTLKHPNIVQTFSTHLVGEELWVLMEPLDGGSLTQLVENLHIAKLTERHMARIAHGAVSALNYLHSLGVIHRDVKSDSILLSTSGQVKLSDFGYCDRVTEEKPVCTGLIGTPHWMSPEIVARKPYGPMTDIWSLGIMMIEMLDGEPPNFSDSQIVAMEKIKVNPSPSPAKVEISSATLSFLTCCLKLEPELRSSALTLLQHRIFSNMATEGQLALLINNFHVNFKASPVLK